MLSYLKALNNYTEPCSAEPAWEGVLMIDLKVDLGRSSAFLFNDS